MNEYIKDLGRIGLKLAIMEQNALIRGLCIDKFKTLCMAAELSDMEDEEHSDNGEDISEMLEGTLPDCEFWAIQLLMTHFARLPYHTATEPM